MPPLQRRKIHHVLSREIIITIASLLPLPSSRLALALTIGSFYLTEILRLVWKSLPSPLPALKLIEKFQVSRRTGRWILPKSFDGADLSRFRYYSQFVEEIEIPTTPTNINVIARKIFQKSGYWFPNLQKCHFREATKPVSFHSVTLLGWLSSRIDETSVHLAVPTAFPCVGWPNTLRSVTLAGAVSETDVSPLASCSNLRNLTVIPDHEFQNPTLTAAAIAVARKLGGLEKLSLCVKGIASAGAMIATLPTLSLRGEPCDIESVLRSFSGLRDVTLDFRHLGGLQSNSCLSCLSQLALHSQATLDRISVHSDWMLHDNPFPLSKALGHLQAIHNVRSFAMSCRPTVILQDDDVCRLIRSMRHLENLTLGLFVTDRGLRLLAGLPRLKTISVKFGSRHTLQIPFSDRFDEAVPSELKYARALFPRQDTSISIPSTQRQVQRQVLLNSDIMETVIDFIDSHELWRLLFMSKQFHALITRRLWRVLPSLVPLMKLLPGDFRKLDGIYNWTPPNREFNLDCFDRHAVLVKDISQGLSTSLSCEVIHESVFKQLNDIRPGHIWLPKLSILRYCPSSSSSSASHRPDLSSTIDAHPVLQMISKHLQVISLDVKGDYAADILIQSQAISSRITEIRLSGLLTDTLTALLGGFTCLTVLSLQFKEAYYDLFPPVQLAGRGCEISWNALYAAFRALERISTLETLSYNMPYGRKPYPAPNGRWCRYLANLRLEGPPSAIEQHLNAFHNLRTTSLYFQPYDLSDFDLGEVLSSCCAQLRDRSGSTMTALSLACRSIPDIFRYIDPLFAISGMRSFAMRLETLTTWAPTPHLRRPDTSKIVTHWPLLEELTFNGRYGGVTPSIHDLAPLSQLPYLMRLELEKVALPVDPFATSNDFQYRSSCPLDIVFGKNHNDRIAPANGFPHRLHDVMTGTYVNLPY